MPQPNPFRYGRPVPPAYFVGRQDAVRTIFNRIRVGDSTAIVGLPHIGKSSLLRYLADAQVRAAQMQGHPVHQAFVEIDCHLLPQSWQPEDFWKRVWSRLRGAFTDPEIQQRVTELAHGPFDHMTLEDHFYLLGRSDARVVLLIDEFDALLHHPRFNGPDFFGALRSLSSRTDGLALVTASRLSVTQMNRRTQEQNLGSPFFNNTTEVRLQPLHDAEIHQLLDRALHGSSVCFAEADRAFLLRLSGRHPYLLQAAAASLFDVILENRPGEDRFLQASQILHERVSAFLDDLRDHLDPGDPLLQELAYQKRPAETPVRLFCSYCHEDEALRDELEAHLSILRRQGIITIWHDRRIVAGETWQAEIDRHLEQADIVLLLISADFLASNYCYDVELQRALERHRTHQATVIPVLLRQVLWQGAPFGKFQCLPSDGRPITSWANRDDAWHNVAAGIQAAASAKR